MDNMELWNKVSTTDPKYTKQVKFGSYKFTDIDSMWNIRRATELWGPYGSTWGLKEFHVTVIYGGENVAGVYVHGTFSYPGGAFSVAADMPYEPKGETLKKLQTMCIGKALSRLGFSADVYMGRFDDSAYVKEMEQQYAVRNNNVPDDGSPTSGSEQTVTKKHAKYPEPDPVASGILGKLCQQYMDKLAGDKSHSGHVVTFKRVCEAVYDAFGKYPTKVESLPVLMERVPLESVIEENDFLKGL